MKLPTSTSKEIAAMVGLEWQQGWLGLELKPIKRKRSVEANARYWACVTALAQFSGDTKQGVHEDALREFHGAEAITGANGQTKIIPKGRSHNLTSEDFVGLSMVVEKWAAEMGVSWEAA
jgi:hypothetical protein